MIYGAIIEGPYRYKLWRYWDDRPIVSFIMLNPSTADAEHDDPTVRKCVGFAKRWEKGGIEVYNLFAWRATDPNDLLDARARHDIVGLANDEFIRSINSPIICAWGAVGRIPHERAVQVMNLLSDRVMARIGPATKNGHPRHPLYAPYALGLCAHP